MLVLLHLHTRRGVESEYTIMHILMSLLQCISVLVTLFSRVMQPPSGPFMHVLFVA